MSEPYDPYTARPQPHESRQNPAPEQYPGQQYPGQQYPPPEQYPGQKHPSPAAQPYGTAFPPARTGIATSSMVLGILGVVLAWVPLIGFLLAAVALVLGIVVLSTGRPGSGRALAGTILGAVGVVIFGVIITLV